MAHLSLIFKNLFSTINAHTYTIYSCFYPLPSFFSSRMTLPLIQRYATFKNLNQNLGNSRRLRPWCFWHFNSKFFPTADKQLSQGPPEIAQVSSYCQTDQPEK